MKLKFLFCAAAAFLSAGCNDEDGSGDFGNLKFPDTGELDQTFKADQTSSRLTFGSWRRCISESYACNGTSESS